MDLDIMADEYAAEKFDLNGDLFMTNGIMNPKELYLQDLHPYKDVLTDLTEYRGASSSDSGISTMDDFQDVANVTDLNSLLDTHFKELDFSLDFVISKNDQDDIFDADVDVKSEPKSPSVYSQLHVSSDYFLHSDVHIKDEGSPLMLPAYHQFDPMSPVASSYSSQPNYNTDPVCEATSVSPKLSLKSQPFQVNKSTCAITTNAAAAPLPFTAEPRNPLLQHLNIIPEPPSSPYSSDSSQHVSPLPPSSPSIIVLPCIKKETQVPIPFPPGDTVTCSGSKDFNVILPATFNIDAILSSKVKIQPKPGSDSVITAGTSQWVTSTSNGQLQAFPIITSSAISTTSTNSLTDEKSFKRAQRIIKNRESASLSRKRKKEYLTSLEERLQKCSDENERLLRENDTLRRQVEFLQRENSGLKNLNISPAKKICLMCLVFLLGLNLSPFSFLSGTSNINARSGIGSTYHPAGRHLMSLLDDDVDRLSDFSSNSFIGKDTWSPSMILKFDEELSLLAKKLNITGRLSNICPMYFNSTESNRLAEQLRGWMISQEEEKKKKEKKRNKKKKNHPFVKNYGTYSFNVNTESAVKTNGNTYPVQLFSGGYYSRQQLLNAVPRRNDTFYVLSFSTDYFLVPATAHNKTMRPRMSLLMPVVTPSINESTGHSQDSVGVMQIDCEILSTNLIHLYHSAFPDETMNNTTSYNKSGTSQNATSNASASSRASPHTNRGNNSGDTKLEQDIWEKLRKSISG